MPVPNGQDELANGEGIALGKIRQEVESTWYDDNYDDGPYTEAATGLSVMEYQGYGELNPYSTGGSPPEGGATIESYFNDSTIPTLPEGFEPGWYDDEDVTNDPNDSYPPSANYGYFSKWYGYDHNQQPGGIITIEDTLPDPYYPVLAGGGDTFTVIAGLGGWDYCAIKDNGMFSDQTDGSYGSSMVIPDGGFGPWTDDGIEWINRITIACNAQGLNIAQVGELNGYGYYTDYDIPNVPENGGPANMTEDGIILWDIADLPETNDQASQGWFRLGNCVTNWENGVPMRYPSGNTPNYFQLPLGFSSGETLLSWYSPQPFDTANQFPGLKITHDTYTYAFTELLGLYLAGDTIGAATLINKKRLVNFHVIYGPSGVTTIPSNEAYGDDLRPVALGQGIIMDPTGFTIGSDEKLKTNIKRIGKSPSGIPIYTFQYKPQAVEWMSGLSFRRSMDRHVTDLSRMQWIGVRAQDLLKTRYAHAVSKIDGYYSVDYSKLDVKPMNSLEPGFKKRVTEIKRGARTCRIT